MSILMYILVLYFIIKSGSYAVYCIKNDNTLGGIGILVLLAIAAALSVILVVKHI